jgi:hypothetical protein
MYNIYGRSALTTIVGILLLITMVFVTGVRPETPRPRRYATFVIDTPSDHYTREEAISELNGYKALYQKEWAKTRRLEAELARRK